MGGDGGSIPKRDDLVKQRKEQKVDKQVEEAVKWRNCALSQEPLCKPVVTCGLGKLYNKTAVIEFLLDRSKYAAVAANASHIQSLRDVYELKLNTGAAPNVSGIHTCPVSGTSMTGKFAFVCLTNCGCTIAERALRELHRKDAPSESDSSQSRACPLCSKPYRDHEVIHLNASNKEQVVANETNMAKRRDEKAAAKRRPNAIESNSQIDQPSSSSKTQPTLEKTETTNKATNKLAAGSKRQVESASSSGLPVKSARTVSTKVGTSMNSVVLPESLKRGSIQHDPNASAAYKSLFTTCEEAKKQVKSNWVTYNPLYFR